MGKWKNFDLGEVAVGLAGRGVVIQLRELEAVAEVHPGAEGFEGISCVESWGEVKIVSANRAW